ncbi:MAG: glycoside hydrolase family 95 protein [Spirochaetia bacterium]|nr:glycoside hydrolase family 95 protein [Spirochaetia bacterium]
MTDRSRILFSLLIFLSSLPTDASAAEPGNRVLFYTSPAENWEQESLPIGNGWMGASLFGGIENERIVLNEKTLWEGGPGEWDGYGKPDPNKGAFALPEIRKAVEEGKYGEAHRLAEKYLTGNGTGKGAYQPLGTLDIRFPGIKRQKGSYIRKLDTGNAVHTVSFSQNGVEYTRNAFASYPDKSIVFSFSADRPQSVAFNLQWETVNETKNYYDTYKNEFVCLNPNVRTGRTETVAVERLGDDTAKMTVEGILNNNGMKYAAVIYIKAVNGTVGTDGKSAAVRGADRAVLFFAAATDYANEYPRYTSGRNPLPVADAFAREAFAKGETRVYRNHIRDYTGLFERTALRLTDSDETLTDVPTDKRLKQFRRNRDPMFLELLFNYGKYLLIASSREGSLPLNLQGVWNAYTAPPWSSDYHTNINLQMAYWPAEPLHLGEIHKPLLDYIPTLVQPGEITARHYYGTGGWVCHTSNNPFGETQPGWGIVWGHFPGAAAWLCRHLWDHYLYTQDTAFLKEVYPTVKGAAQFWADWLTTDKNGNLISCPSYSPEHGTISAGATMDFEIAFEILNTAITASEILGTDNTEREIWRSIVSRIPPLKIGRWGQLQEWTEDIDSKTDKHRHISHLYALHPGTQISPITTPETAKAAAVTLKARGDKATGWSMAWKMNFYARLGDGDHSYKLLRNFVRFTERSGVALSGGGFYRNLWDAHPPFQIDGNFGIVSAFIEWVLQSHNGEIHLLPALPSAIKNGRFDGFKAAGGFTVSASWKKGKMNEAVIRSDAGKPLTVRYAGKTVDIDLKRGESVRLNGNLEILSSDR